MIMIACCQLEFSILDHGRFGVRVVAGVVDGIEAQCAAMAGIASPPAPHFSLGRTEGVGSHMR